MSLVDRLRCLVLGKKTFPHLSGTQWGRRRAAPPGFRSLRMECLEERTVLSVSLPAIAGDLAVLGPALTSTPAVLSVTPSVTTITSADVGGVFTLRVVFNDTMDQTVFPTVSFPFPPLGQDPTINTLVNPTGAWLDSQTFQESFDVAASQELQPNIDVQVSGGLSTSGIFQTPTLVPDVFTIATLPTPPPAGPLVLSVTPSVTTVSDANAGTGTFALRVIFNVAMDQAVFPTISFPTPGEDAAAFTLQNPTGVWLDSQTFRATFDVNDVIEEVLPDIDVLVEDARSTLGILQTPTLVPDVFTVDTAEPTVEVSTADGGLQGLVGEPLLFTFTATSPSPIVQDGQFTFRIKWGDGSQQNLIGPATATASHVFTTAGVKIVSVIVEDQFDVRSIAPVTLRLTILNAMQQGPDVVLAGTLGNDRFTLIRGSLPTVFLVSLNNSSLGRFTVAPSGQVLIFGRGGNDTVAVRGTSAANVFVATATGLALDGTIIDAPDVTTFQLIGNGGSDTLVGVLDAANTFRLTGLMSGNLNGRFRFSGIRNLTGGIDADTFLVTNRARGFGTVDGGAGSDTLDFSALTRAFTVNLKTSTAPAIRRFTNVENVIGNNRTATLLAPNIVSTFVVDGPNTGTIAGIRFSRFNRLVGAGKTIV